MVVTPPALQRTSDGKGYEQVGRGDGEAVGKLDSYQAQLQMYLLLAWLLVRGSECLSVF